MSCASEAAGQELDTGDHEPGESTFDGGLEILGETAVSVEPGDGALDHPAALDEVEARGGLDALDDFDRPLAELFECGLEFVAGVAGIGEDMAQPGKGIADGGEEERGSITILEACFMHDRADQQARCVGQDVALAALDLLAGVIPSRAAGFGGLDRLAVDDPGGGTRFAAHRFTRQHQQDMVDLPPQAVVAPGIEVVLHRGKGREILGQHAPLAAALGDVEDGVHHRSQRRRAPPPAPLVRRWHQCRDHRPFAIGGVACRAKPTPLILRSSDFCPHLVPPSSLANTTESQDTEITHLNFGSASKVPEVRLQLAKLAQFILSSNANIDDRRMVFVIALYYALIPELDTYTL